MDARAVESLEAEVPISTLRRAAGLIRDLRQVRRDYRVGWAYLIGRFFGPLRQRGLSRRAAIYEGLLDPRISEEALEVTVSRAHLLALQQCVNPSDFGSLAKEKAIFYAYCSARGLPVPRFLGLAAKPAGYSADGNPLASSDDWKRFATSLPDEFIVKPSRGAYGRGVRLFRRVHGGFVDDGGRRWEAEQLGRAAVTHPAYDSFVIQECLSSHPELARLSGSSRLQTVRIVSWVRADGVVVLPMAVLKVIVGDNLMDNYDHGRSGNLLALADSGSGVLEAAVGPRAPNSPATVHRVHPGTAVCFDGFSIPLWEQARSLVCRAAIQFLPLRAIGWDVAITPSGPLLVEGNNFWDPFNYLAHSRRKEVLEPAKVFLRELEASCPRKGR